ncbi:MAG: VOC family protein [Gemmatimonadaceae bacterium]|nr:VOC family protein [Gemmatimonadaceae bacterium]
MRVQSTTESTQSGYSRWTTGCGDRLITGRLAGRPPHWKLIRCFEALDSDLVGAGAGKKWDGAPAGTVIGHVHLYVDDLGNAEKFYHEAIGFDKVNLEFAGALFMSAGGYHHNLGTNTWAAQSPQATDGDARLLEWSVTVPAHEDVERLSQSLRENGFSVEHYGTVATAIDPWGTRVRFTALA